MKSFRKFVVVAAIATYFLIFVGGLVRVSGAGLGCPDWPTCFGRWMPPTDVSQLPPDIDPAQFNFALAWIEYVNRLIGIIVGLFIAVTALWALAKFRRYTKILLPAVVAAILVAYQGWQGGRMIEAELASYLVSIHMGLAFIIGCLMIYTAQQAYYLENGLTPGKSSLAGNARLWLAILVIISIVQVVLGTQVRTALETVADEFPLLAQSQWLQHVGVINIIHVILGIVVTVVAWQAGAGIIRRKEDISPLTFQITWSMIILATVQLAIGLVMIFAGVPDLLQLFHLVASSLFIGALVLLLSAIPYEGRTT